ncbi:hypothetical protein Q8F55_000560 [Vanrija albida]|uniref:Uncharacterized protein n=1 Tax=Vanrija albida TaxID=181172 RepID=A0ABR3QDT5_9TREE
MATVTPTTGGPAREAESTATPTAKPTKHSVFTQATFTGSSSYDVRNGVWVPVASAPKKVLADGTLIGVIVACIVGGLIVVMLAVPFVKKLLRRRQSIKARRDAEALLNAPSPSCSFDADREKAAAATLSPTVGARSRASSFNTLQHVAPRRQPSSSMLSTHSRSTSAGGRSPSPHGTPPPGKTFVYVDHNGLLTPESPKLNLNLSPGQTLSPQEMERVKRVSAQSAVSAYSTVSASTLSPPAPRFQDSLGYQYGSEEAADFMSDETHSDERPFAYDTASARSTLTSAHEPTLVRPVVEARHAPAQYASRENDPANPFANPPRFIQPGEGGRRSLTAPVPAPARPVSVGKAF